MHSTFLNMPHLESNIPLSINYISIDSEILRFARTNFDSKTFITLANQLLKIIQEKGSKHRSIIAMLKKIFSKHSNVFNILQTQQIISSNFSHCIKLWLLISIFVFFL